MTKPKSPPVPSYTLGDCIDDLKQVYNQYTRGSFTKSEIASVLELSATSSATTKRIFSYKEFRLLNEEGESYSVSESLIKLKDADKTSANFKNAAIRSIKSSKVFSELLDDFSEKIPDRENLSNRLENQMHFNPKRAKKVAKVFEDSLRFANVLDSNNNVLPIREPENNSNNNEASKQNNEEPSSEKPAIQSSQDNLLKMEIAISDGKKAVIFYPPEMTSGDASKISGILNALSSNQN